MSRNQSVQQNVQSKAMEKTATAKASAAEVAQQEGQKKKGRPKDHGKAIGEKTAALLQALSAARTEEFQFPAKDCANVAKMLDEAMRFVSLTPVPPYTPLPPPQMPTTWQTAHLAALIGQGHPEKLQSIAHELRVTPSAAVVPSSRAYETANDLTNAALTLWRSAHDMRQIWQQQPWRQQNYQAGRLFLLAPTNDEQDERRSKLIEILYRLAPMPSDKSHFGEIEQQWAEKNQKGVAKVNRDRFCEYWLGRAFVTWDEAAILFFRNKVKPEEKPSPGKATQTQSKLLKAFVSEHLINVPYAKEVAPGNAEVIKCWNAGLPNDARPLVLQEGYFTDFWEGLLVHSEGLLQKRMSERMKGIKNRIKPDGSAEP